MKRNNFFYSKNILQIIVICSLLVLLLSCSKKEEDSNGISGSIEVAGSSTVFPITSAIAEEFIKIHGEVNIPIRSTGTGGGFQNFFVEGKTDINNASRPIKDSEFEKAKANDIVPIEFQVAIDAITVVVSKDFFLDDISTEDLKKIWHPDSAPTQWSEVNPSWPQDTISLYGPTSASGTFDYFTEVIMGEGGVSRNDYQKTEHDNTIITAVSDSPTALGYLGLAYYLENADTVKALTVNNVSPSIEHARTGVYAPLSRPIYIYVSSQALKRKEVQEFLRFYITETAGGLIEEIGYVPVTEEIRDANLEKLEEAIKTYGGE